MSVKWLWVIAASSGIQWNDITAAIKTCIGQKEITAACREKKAEYERQELIIPCTLRSSAYEGRWWGYGVYYVEEKSIVVKHFGCADEEWNFYRRVQRKLLAKQQ